MSQNASNDTLGATRASDQSILNENSADLEISGSSTAQEKEPHRNSKDNTDPHHRYEIMDNTGDVVKTGISGRALNKNGTSPRANSQVNRLNKTNAKGHPFKAVVQEKNIPGRAAALTREQAATNQLKKAGNTLRLQQRPKPQ